MSGTNIQSWIGAASAAAAVITFVLGFLKWLKNLRDQAAKEDVGAIACDKRRMGYFVAKKQPWGSLLCSSCSCCRCCRRRTILLQLPFISGLIEAGDGLAFSSSMFDWIPHRHEDVSWKNLYEAFYNEIAWKLWEEGKFSWNSSYEDFFTSNGGSLSREHRNFLKSIKRVLDQAHSYVSEEEKKWKSGSIADRHLLYESTPSKPEPKLVNCIKSLERLENYNGISNDPIHGPRSIWTKLHEIWIHNDHPCIEVSSEELAALAFVLGMPLELSGDGNELEVRAKGVFGTTLNGSFPIGKDEFFSLRFGYCNRGHPSHEPSKGSGYSIPFAKFLACGCLPFGEKDGFTHVIPIDNAMLIAIKKGENILDGSYTDEPKPVQYLHQLPSKTRPYYYPKTRADEDTKGRILNKSLSEIGTWTKAVAGIAFGGLVPMAALDLIEAVKFTASGGQKFNSDGLIELDRLVIRIEEHSRGLQLFGPYVERRFETEHSPSVGIYGQQFHELDLRDGAARFSRYMTMLERITAQLNINDAMMVVFEKCCAQLDTSYKIAMAHTESEPTHEMMELENIGSPRFIATESTTIALNEFGRMQFHSHIADTEIVDGGHYPQEKPDNCPDIGKEITEICGYQQPFDVDTCAKIARFIIVAWSYQAGIVVWDDEEHDKARKSLKGNEKRIYRPVPIDKIPSPSIIQ